MIINHNLSAINAQRNNNIKNFDVGENISKLSSGLRINRAADDAAGLAISEKMRAQIRGLQQASRNTMDGVSFIQTAEGYLEETTSILQRLRELSVQSANGIYTSTDRAHIQVEVSQLVDEIDRIASQAQFNGMILFTGRFSGNGQSDPLYIHMGANTDQREQLSINTMTASALQIKNTNAGTSLNLSSAEDANSAISILDNALNIVSEQRADLGAYQNRLEAANRGINIGAENLQAAESRIRDLDMAEEVVRSTTNQILQQSSLAMIAQANQQAQLILQLLR